MAQDNDINSMKNEDQKLNETTEVANKILKGQKAIMWIIGVLAVIVCLILIYIFAIRRPGVQAADEAVGQADMTMMTGNDSIALAQYRQVADNYGYEGGNRAHLNAAILLYQDGKYEEAISYLKKYNPTEKIIGASSQSLEGDCYVNLKEYQKALDCFKKAIKLSDDNPALTPLFMLKAATVLREMKDYKGEAEMYRELQKEFPNFEAQSQVEVSKYLKRAELQSEETK